MAGRTDGGLLWKRNAALEQHRGRIGQRRGRFGQRRGRFGQRWGRVGQRRGCVAGSGWERRGRIGRTARPRRRGRRRRSLRPEWNGRRRDFGLPLLVVGNARLQWECAGRDPDLQPGLLEPQSDLCGSEPVRQSRRYLPADRPALLGHDSRRAERLRHLDERHEVRAGPGVRYGGAILLRCDPDLSERRVRRLRADGDAGLRSLRRRRGDLHGRGGRGERVSEPRPSRPTIETPTRMDTAIPRCP